MKTIKHWYTDYTEFGGIDSLFVYQLESIFLKDFLFSMERENLSSCEKKIRTISNPAFIVVERYQN